MGGYIFVAGKGAIDQVMVAGQSVVTNGRHHKREPISARYARTLARILT
jgi:formimidoylglutamate deiminase